MNITKAELANSLRAKLNLPTQDAKDLVDNFFAVICGALAQGEDVKISRFGNFALRKKNARPGRNPRTRVNVVISERTVVTFKQGQKLKEMVSEDVLCT